MKAAIRVEEVSKRYRIGVSESGNYRTLRECLSTAAATGWRRLKELARQSTTRGAEPNTHWALRDVSFEVKPGEVVGIIGQNGAGKSTLLKVLSRITEPTSGRVCVRGRLGSLLEVGTGFHPELTGRENVFLNGAILGMTRREIARKFDEIVAFAEIEKFLDTAVKRYSSGMYVRLAFAVAAHLEPEILLVDEVLAVGDVAFQNKCIDRVKELGRGGASILFVSHNMGIVASLCQRAVTMEGGRAISNGPAREEVRQYVAGLTARSEADLEMREDRVGNGVARIVGVAFVDGAGVPIESALAGQPLTIRFSFKTFRAVANLEIHAWLCNEMGDRITILSSRYTGDVFRSIPSEGYFECAIRELNIIPGRYLVTVNLESGLEDADYIVGAARLQVEPGPFFATGRTPGAEHGLLLTRHAWQLGSVAEGDESVMADVQR